MISYKKYLSLLIVVLCPVLFFSCKKNEQAVSEKNSGTEMPPVKAEGKETENVQGIGNRDRGREEWTFAIFGFY